MKLWPLVAGSVVFGAFAAFGIVVATAADHPSTPQIAIAWALLVVLVACVLVFLGSVGVGTRRLVQRGRK